MRKLKFFLIVLSFFTALTASAQEITVSGTVTSAESGEKLYGAYVLVGIRGAETDDEGYYSVSAKAGERLVFRYIGCTSVEFVVPAGKSEIVYDVALKLDNPLMTLLSSHTV